MSDLRTFGWRSGRLSRTSIRDFWQAPSTLDAADPQIPSLPLETAAAGGVIVTPSTLAMTLATFVATVLTPRLVTPGLLALTLTTFAPVVTVGVNVTPATAALTTATFAPTVSTPRLVTPGTLALTMAVFAPTVSTPRLVTPNVAALSLTGFAPMVTGFIGEIEIEQIVEPSGIGGGGGGGGGATNMGEESPPFKPIIYIQEPQDRFQAQRERQGELREQIRIALEGPSAPEVRQILEPSPVDAIEPLHERINVEALSDEIVSTVTKHYEKAVREIEAKRRREIERDDEAVLMLAA